jgi:hypothetical protein
MLTRFDHRPMLTALLALSTAVLVVVVITLSTLLITSAPAVSPSSESGGAGAEAVAGTGDFYGEGWNNYGHDAVLPKPAQKGDSQISDATERQEVGHP